MESSATPPANSFVRTMRRLYNPLGFSKGYNFTLWFITIGYIFGFTLSRLMYFSFYGQFCNPQAGANGAAPGECYYYLQNPWRVGIQLHLFCILPAALLVCLQFTPWIRHKAMIFHRINGYLIITLSLISDAGALIIAQVSFGGGFSERTFVGTLVIVTTLAYVMAYINIKLLQIDQHRAWMIRAWAYFATIVTIRIIMSCSASIITIMGGWYTDRPCAQIAFTFGQNNTLTLYPVCASYFNGTNPWQRAIIEADFNSSTDPIEIGAALAIPFGTAGWLSLLLHALAIEIYLRLTPNETLRLKQVSYERQLARGVKRPGYAGLVAERFGDCGPYVPPVTKGETDSDCTDYAVHCANHGKLEEAV